MPSNRLPKRAERLFIDVLLNDWQPSGAQGYDATQSDTSADDFLPVATTIDDVGAVYPSVVATRSNESSGGETTYDFMTGNGPGQNRNGQLVVTARAADMADGGYTGDSGTYSAVEAEDIVDILINEVEDVCGRNPLGGTTEFSYLGSQRGADAPDDLEKSPPVRIEQCTVAYGWLREP